MRYSPAAAAAALLLAAIVACGGSSGLAPSSPGEALERARRAAENAGGYKVSVQGHDLVLPQWGGVDSGTVEVGVDQSVARADLYRTGDGPYAMILVGGETFFQRTTCDHFARVPGGGLDVLRPFLWTESGLPATLSDPQYSAGASGDRIVVLADSELLGAVQIELERESYLPLRLLRADDGNGRGETEWLFSDWGSLPSVSKPAGEIGDQGPGGNPC